MADYSFDGGQPAPRAHNVASMANWAGAAVSLTLVVGIGVWGYKLIARDVSGVPVVMAMQGPMRIAPEKPGGELADHQGLAVNAVAGTGTAAPPADRLVLAPSPAGLAEEDVALGLIQPVPPMVQAVSLRTGDAPALGDDPQVSFPPDSPLAHMSDVDKVVAQLIQGVEPLAPLDPDQDGADSAEAEIVVDEGPGLRRSLRPRMRPGGLQVASLDPVLPAAAETREVDADTLPLGTRLVQIGAFDSAEDARAAWGKLDQRFGDYLKGKDRVIQQASSGGRTFYRLRAHGFDDLNDARRFCAALVAGNVDCIPVVTR
jgi:hypothetical protein